MKIRMNVTATRCELKESYNTNLEQVVAGATILTVIAIVLLATVIDIVRRYLMHSGSDTMSLSTRISYRSGRLGYLLSDAWTSFSAYTNCPRLLTTSVSDDQIKSLYGLKVVNLIWIILAHSYLTLDLKAVGQLLQTQKVNSLFVFQIVMNASLAVETFFFISGVVVTLSVMKRLETQPGMRLGQWIWFYVHRLVRMTPAVILVIAIVLSAYQLSDGPLWREIIYPSAERCRKNWWIHFLHISNYFDVSRMVRRYCVTVMSCCLLTKFFLCHFVIVFPAPVVHRSRHAVVPVHAVPADPTASEALLGEDAAEYSDSGLHHMDWSHHVCGSPASHADVR
jgi:hypothetical protein